MNAARPYGPFRVETAAFADACSELLAVREAVFVVEQNVPVEEERDAHDPRCLHAIARDRAGKPIGTGRLVPPTAADAPAHVGRMAVLRDWRGAGVGDALLHALLRQARERGWNDIVLNAQVSAQSFYARHGFVPVGERFIEAGIEHQAMRRRIDRPQAIEGTDAAVAATAAIVRHARRRLHVYSRELDPGLLDAPRVLDAMRELCTRGDGIQVQVLLQDAAAPQRALAPLLALAQRLPSVIAFREIADPVDRAYPSAYLANDDGGYYFRALGHRLDGEAETGAPGLARQLAEHFRPVWERSRPCTEYRTLGL
ncbi:GNAT family N-acetyltransferase [Luteimonas soli]|uniref:GNAT family N-acetyltransferase n=1 Tax=Luteimonas soli TaxID=1648966 RepID=A0ABV7XJJ2_9GAMM